MTLRAYNKWTARVALVVLACAVVVGIAAIPMAVGQTAWPLSEHFGSRHMLAVLEVGFGWVVIGIAVLVAIGFIAYGLLRRAEWAE